MDEAMNSVYSRLSQALETKDYVSALEYCRQGIAWGDDSLRQLYKWLANTIKDGNINHNIQLFLAQNRNTLPPRENHFQMEVIIPCYNQGRFLNDALRSVPQEIPVTVINDASTDDTSKEIASLAKLYPFSLYTNATNLNQSGSINLAVSRSSSNLFVVLNADDALVCYAIATILDIYRSYEEVRMVGGNCTLFEESGQLPFGQVDFCRLGYVPKPKIFMPEDALHFNHPNDLNMTMSGCSFLKSAWQAAGGLWDFEKRVCSFDDRDFQMRVAALFPVAVLDESLAYYRTNSSVGRGRFT
ncbi:MAG: putative glycosyltransferase protein [Firmicutes bacterium]|nr:putative glycosyltransferase protein [Bacillota bacterium]